MKESNPIAGTDYPRNLSEFQGWFAADETCAAYLEQLRWPSGFSCQACGLAGTPRRATRGRLICRAYRRQRSVTAGTIFDKTRTRLRAWLAAAWCLTSQKQGVSALGLQQVLGLSSYQTAWAMLNRFHRAMVRTGRDLLKGTVDVDETYLELQRGTEARPKARSSKAQDRKNLVAVAVAIKVLEPKGFGRVRLRRIQAPTIDLLLPFVHKHIAPSSSVRTDDSPIYAPLQKQGFDHIRHVILGSNVLAHQPLPGVHRVAALLKRWLLGTHHGAIDPRHGVLAELLRLPYQSIPRRSVGLESIL